ncbi:MAG: DNA-formamidopyrimidine glycosylase [Bacilli bacterium]|nr:DNA-formamidopyrimidine glycosylase [Bacilli bacterium]
MPELPEVETVVRALNHSIKGRTFKDVIVYHKNIIEGNEKTFIAGVKNKTINAIKRRGKFLIFDLSGPNVMIAHLRMEGKFIPAKTIKDKTKYARIIFTFKDGSILNFDDSRCFGFLTLRDKKNYQNVLPLAKVGVEAIDPKLNVNQVYKMIHASKRNIKETLLDQSIVSGLGNIYVDETLFQAKISPLSKAYLLSKDDVKRILKCANTILHLAIKHNGTTVSTFYWEKGHTGGFQKYLKAYGRKGKPCVNCGNPLAKIKVGGRGTTYCPHCQKRKSDHYVIGITGPISVGKSTALNVFKDNGYLTYSADEVVKRLYQKVEVKEKLNRLFKTNNKDQIRLLVSKSPAKLRALNHLLHPLVKEDLRMYLTTHQGNIAVEIPLLFQADFTDLVDETLLILSEQNTRLIKARGAKASTQLQINAAATFKAYIRHATYLINNDASKAKFINQVKKIIH